MEQFDPVPAFVHEDVHVSIHRIAADLVPYKAAQRMEALPHARRLAVQPVPEASLQVKHGWMML